jgi:hypothetical protein
MRVWDKTGPVPEPARSIAILWLTFLMAGIATTFLFAFIDPEQLQPCLDIFDMGRLGIYTLGFFLFWLLAAASSFLTTYFLLPSRPPEEGSEDE